VYPPAAPTGAGTSSDTSVKDKAAGAADAAKQAGGEVASTAAEKAKDVAAETKRQARDLVGEARNQVQSQVGDQHRNLVTNIRSLGDELGSMAGSGEQHGLASEIVSQAGDRARGVADWLDGRDPSQLLDEVRSFARRKPGVFLAGALIAGVAVGRLTRGVVATHTEDSDSSISGGNGAELGAYGSYPVPNTPSAEPVGYTPTNATDYSAPPVGTGVAETGPSAGYGGVTGDYTSPRHDATAETQLLPGTPPGFGEQR